ncbi:MULTISPECIES: restriction endonuclease subunit S [Pseudomonas]|uniref:restriction endonuclease subunit S n=1 Tax=Pseudomonas TaxID=286 RepID=UPI000C10D902|nr:hypothetical protein [Pseudomonadaceae bacterium]HCP54941.1 hypothetical protein [Pseudomonas sp.]
MEQVIYPLPDGWKYQKLKSLIKMHYGKALKAVDRIEGEVLVYGSNGVVGSHNEHLWSQPTVVIGRKGSVGEANLALTPSWTIDTAYYVEIIDHEVLDLLYFYYFADRFDVSSISQKGVKPGISRNDYLGLNFPLPPLIEQKRIVEKLDALHTRIDTAIEHLQESARLADALYSSAINEQMMQAIELVGLFTVEKYIDQIQTGTTPPTNQPEFYENGDINWFAPSDFGDHDILSDSNKKLSQRSFDAGKARKFDAGTIMLVAIGATIGKVGYLEQDASSNQQITGMKFNSDIIPKYAYYWFRFIKPEILANASIATLPIINQKGIKALSFCAPNKELQEAICKRIDEVSNFRNSVKAELNEKVELICTLKASILDSAFKGEL